MDGLPAQLQQRSRPGEEREGGREEPEHGKAPSPICPQGLLRSRRGDESEERLKLLPDSCSRRSQEVKVDPPVGL